MPRLRIAGIPTGVADPDKREVAFTLAIAGGLPLQCEADIGVTEQIISALARMAKDLRQSKPQMTAAENVAEALVQRDAFGGPVLLRLVTPEGVPYTFALPPGAAVQIADRLKKESEKPVPQPKRN